MEGKLVFAFSQIEFTFPRSYGPYRGPLDEENESNSTFFNGIQFNLFLIGQKRNHQEGLFILGPGKFDSIEVTKSKNTYLGEN